MKVSSQNARAERHPGRRGTDEIERDIVQALRVVDDPDALGQLPLARDFAVEDLARQRYGRVTRLARGQALRDLLRECLERVAGETHEPFRSFADAYAAQTPIAEIARQLGMSRSHLSRIYRRRVAALVADELLSEIRSAPSSRSRPRDRPRG